MKYQTKHPTITEISIGDVVINYRGDILELVEVVEDSIYCFVFKLRVELADYNGNHKSLDNTVTYTKKLLYHKENFKHSEVYNIHTKVASLKEKLELL